MLSSRIDKLGWAPRFIDTLVEDAVARAGLDPTTYSTHSLRADFVTYTHVRGATDHRTRHRSLATLGRHLRPHPPSSDRQRRQHPRL